MTENNHIFNTQHVKEFLVKCGYATVDFADNIDPRDFEAILTRTDAYADKGRDYASALNSAVDDYWNALKRKAQIEAETGQKLDWIEM